MVFFRPGFALAALVTLAAGTNALACGAANTGAPAASPEGAAPAATPEGAAPDASALTPTIDNPYAGFGSVRSAVYAGKERDEDTGKLVPVRMTYTVRDEPATVGGIQATVVEVSDFEDGELAEKTRDYYAQDAAGIVYYVGEHVDDYEGGKVTGHGGQWIAGEKDARPGIFMPAAPKVGDAFEQERAPGVAEDQTKVIAKVASIKVPAGTFEDCIEVEDFDPISKAKQRKVYCRGVGLVREVLSRGGTIELIEVHTR